MTDDANDWANVDPEKSNGHLRQFIERIETLDAEKKEVADQMKDVYAEAKGNGFDTKAMREIIKLRKKSAETRAEEEAMVDLYKHHLGMA